MPPNWNKRPSSMDNKRGHTNHATETTPLVMMPSAHSTDLSSSENLAMLEAAANASNTANPRNSPYLSSSHRSKDDNDSTKVVSYGSDEQKQQHARRQRLRLGLALVITLLVLVALVLFGNSLLAPENKTDDTKEDMYLSCQEPFSRLHPVKDLGLPSFDRPTFHPASSVLGPYKATHATKAIPTNAWYQNLVMLQNDQEPTEFHRAYAIPYVLDAAGPMGGLRMHTNHVSSSSNILQLISNAMHGVTMGAIHKAEGPMGMKHFGKAYSIQEMTQLAITLQWDDFKMSAPIVKGMPYATMVYEGLETLTDHGLLVPAISTEVPVNQTVVVDQQTILKCTTDEKHTVLVEKEIQFYVPESDFTWLTFVSEPVEISCQTFGRTTIFQVENGPNRVHGQVKPFVFRTALFKSCTHGRNPVYCHQEQMHPFALFTGQGDFGMVLRNHAHLYPGPKASVSYEFDDDETEADLVFDWNAQTMCPPLYPVGSDEEPKDMIAHTLPHHLDMMPLRSPADDLYCASSLVGPSCLVEGSKWKLREKFPPIGFRAERALPTWSLKSIANSLNEDIDFRLPDFFQRGVGDTYFSGKMLARLGRILLIDEEVREICTKSSCREVQLPPLANVTSAIDSLRASVEIWINGTAQAPFVFDEAWGGVASCGCLFNEGECDNAYPNCPAFSDPGLNFGNAFYNDMHFHYGYHIFGAAVVAHFDPDWGRKFFDQVMLLIRNIANPSEDDEFFPIMRHKDIYQGHSWASGIATWVHNGRNQESSSESLAAYESVALYGKVMASIFSSDKEESPDRYHQAVEVRRVGKLLTASELRSAKKYYHVKRNEVVKIYPSAYTPHVIGIMWQTMAQFQTWFGGASYLATGIQLLPLTPIAGPRDDLQWSQEMYPAFENSCNAASVCEEQGWSILQLGALSTVGHPELAFARAKLLPASVFESAGGNGHSMSNTLWYIATRKIVSNRLPIRDYSSIPSGTYPAKKYPKDSLLTDCYRPETCTDFVLDTIVDVYSCRQRITFLIENMHMSQKDACVQIASQEYPDECGACNPLKDSAEAIKEAKEAAARRCPPCTEKQCRSDLNRCPTYEHTYSCTDGPNRGGCSDTPWTLESWMCTSCCELTNCPKTSSLETEAVEISNESDCPLCTNDQCKKNLCPIQSAPFKCIQGPAIGGCSPEPWVMDKQQCNECCKIHKGCLE